MSGKLYIIATPIGNLGDISPRVKESLSESDLILAEDTRVTIKLLNHLNLKKRMISCHDHNEATRLSLVQKANTENQTLALVSDAGTPLISDPGFKVVTEAIRHGMCVIPIPGPSALLLALIASGLPCDRFTFEGFLPDKEKALKNRLEQLVTEPRTMIFYVAPHKLLLNLKIIIEVFGERQICLARELTKKYEEVLRLTASKLLSTLKSKEILGECVLVVAGASEITTPALEPDLDADIQSTIKAMLSQGLGAKTISAECATRYRLKKSVAYRLTLNCIAKMKES